MLRLDNYVKNKKITQTNFVADRRRLRVGRTREEVTILHIEKELMELKIPGVGHLARELFKINGVEKLNHKLLGIVYTYFEKRNFDFSNVVMQFDVDFEKELRTIADNGNLKNLDIEDKSKIYKLRQDFIIYLFIIDRMREEPDKELIEKEDVIDLEEEEATAIFDEVDYEYNVDDEDEYISRQ